MRSPLVFTAQQGTEALDNFLILGVGKLYINHIKGAMYNDVRTEGGGGQPKLDNSKGGCVN